MLTFDPIDADVTFEIDAVAAKKYNDKKLSEYKARLAEVNDPAALCAKFNAAQAARRAKLNG
jgi:hypothetical protein